MKLVCAEGDPAFQNKWQYIKAEWYANKDGITAIIQFTTLFLEDYILAY